MKWTRSLVLGAGAILAAAAATAIHSGTATAADPLDYIFVTDDCAAWLAGCDAIAVVDARDGNMIASGETRFSPGRLAVTSDGALAVASFTNNEYMIATLALVAGATPGGDRWVTKFVPARIDWGGPIAVSPDDRALLLTTPGEIQKYRLDDIRDGVLGAPAGTIAAAGVADIVFAADSATAYAATATVEVLVLDVQSMAAIGAAISYQPVNTPAARRIRNTFSALSPDGRYLVINTGGPKLNIVHLAARISTLVNVPGLAKTLGVAFDHASPEGALLAVHGHTKVGLYKLAGDRLEFVDSIGVPAQVPPVHDPPIREDLIWPRVGSLAWTGRGDAIIAAIGGGPREFRIIDVRAGGQPVLAKRLDFDACTYAGERADSAYQQEFDVVTLNKPGLNGPPPTPAATMSSSPTVSTTPSWTTVPSETPSPTAAAPKTSTPDPTPTATRAPTETAVPEPLFLPIALRERCDPEYQRSDIALVIDTSSSMTGQKIEDARDAALTFAGLIDLEPGRGQVALVRFDREAEVVRELTRSRALIEAAVRSLHVRSGTDIDKGLRAALGELQSPRHLERNAQVLILLTDGVQTGTPGEELRAAAEVRDAGVRVYTIGLGADVDEATLQTIAGADDRYYFAPDSSDLACIYSEIARDLMCPGVELWGGR